MHVDIRAGRARRALSPDGPITRAAVVGATALTRAKDEWDVQIPKGKGFETSAGSKNQGKDHSHANISKKGYVTH